MSRRVPRRRGPRAAGLFAWTAEQQLIEDQAPDADRRNPCPYCNASPWKPCTRGIRGGGRVNLRGVHDSRRQEAQ